MSSAEAGAIIFTRVENCRVHKFHAVFLLSAQIHTCRPDHLIPAVSICFSRFFERSRHDDAGWSFASCQGMCILIMKILRVLYTQPSASIILFIYLALIFQPHFIYHTLYTPRQDGNDMHCVNRERCSLRQQRTIFIASTPGHTFILCMRTQIHQFKF
jgi:hypothetical protein